MNVLELARGGGAGERLGRRERLTVTREDVADLALGNGDEPRLVDAVLEGQEVVETTAQEVRLVAGLAVQRDEAALDGAGEAPPLLDDTDAIVGDVADTREENQDHEEREGNSEDGEPVQRKHMNKPSLRRFRRGRSRAKCTCAFAPIRRPFE